MSEPAFLRQCSPPWLVFPHINPDELTSHLKQGVAEAWFDQEWRPFWSTLSAVEKDEYLGFWRASDTWRNAILTAFNNDPDLDLEADARESEQHLKEFRERRAAKSSLFGRIFRRP